MLSINKIYELGSGLNIEGGYPYHDLIKQNNNAKRIWVNLVVVLDRPLIDNIVFDEIVANNKYPLLENAIENLNEHHFLATYLMTIGYYLEHGRNLVELSDSDKLKITIHVHQDITCLPLIDIIKHQLSDLITNCRINMENIELDFRTDTKTYVTTTHNYKDTHYIPLS